MSEEWTDAPVVSAATAGAVAAAVALPDIADIKLFGRWSTSDVQVSDISLTVSEHLDSMSTKSLQLEVTND